VQPPCNVGATDRKPYIDVMENVFGGVRIMLEDEPGSPRAGADLRGRPLLTDVTMSAVHVRRLADRPDEDDERDL